MMIRSCLWILVWETALLSPMLYTVREAVGECILSCPRNTVSQALNLWSSTSFCGSWRQHSTSSGQPPGPPCECYLQDRVKSGSSGVSHVQERWPLRSSVSCCWQGTRGAHPSLGPVATWGALWNQMSEQQWEFVCLMDSIRITWDEASWRAPSFHYQIQTSLIQRVGSRGQQN